LNLDNRYGKNISLHVAYKSTLDDDFIREQHLHWFWKKRTELAWPLLHIMSEVHKTNNLHNDISLGNILLHFPVDKLQVYIEVCD
jgi:hypothetical protein